MKSSSRSVQRGAPAIRVVAALAVVLGSGGCAQDGTEDHRPAHPLAGRAIHALGQEPGWMVDMDPTGETVFILDYGTDTVAVGTPAPVLDDGEAEEDGLTYRMESADRPLVLTLSVEDCTDSMSGHPFPYTATLQVGDRELQGCAEPLADGGQTDPGSEPAPGG